MPPLDKFSGSLKIYDKEEQAFRMDGKGDKDMRPLAGLGTCNICDYFIIRDDTVILVEETDIVAKKHELDKICAEWKDRKNAEKFIDKSMRNENVLKVLGSLLVLCRLASKCEDVKNIFHKNKYDFWLVDDEQRPDLRGDTMVDDNFNDGLREHLASALTDKAVGNVLVLPSGFIECVNSK